MNEVVDLDLVRSGSISGRTQYTYDDEKGHSQQQAIPKLSRDELEDRYYRVYEQNIDMKKRLNDVDNKNRRLTTKLIRLSRNPCGLEAEADRTAEEQAQRLHQLEQSEAALRVKVKVLREQLAAHTRLHSGALHRRHIQSARTQVGRQSRSQTRDSDYLGTRSAYTLDSVRSRSYGHQRPQSEESNRRSEEDELKKQIAALRETIDEQQKGFAVEKKRYQEQLSQLEAELSEHLSADCADNIEVIRLRRNMRQHEIVLSSRQQELAAAQRDLSASRNALAQAAKDLEGVSEHLIRERQKCLSLQQEVLLLTQECASARDLLDQIADLKRENATLKQHNNQLLLLTKEKEDSGATSNSELRQLTSSTLQQLREECAACQRDVTEARAERSAAQHQLEAARQDCLEHRRRAEEERVNAETWREAHQRLQRQLDEVNSQLVAATKRLDDVSTQLLSGQDLNKRFGQERDGVHQGTQTDSEYSQANLVYPNPVAESSSISSHLNRQNPFGSGLSMDARLSLLEQTTVATGSASSNLVLSGNSLQDRFFKLCSSSGLSNIVRPQSVSDGFLQDQDSPTPTPAPRRTRSHEQMTLSVGQLDAVWELEKCRELLRVQCNLNSMYKKEVTSLTQIVRSLASSSPP